MGFFSNLVSATVKVALSPIAVVKDAANIVAGEEPNALKKVLRSAGEDLEDAGDDLANGNA